MKKILITIIALMSIPFTAIGQNRQVKDKIKVEVGFAMFSNSMNRDRYLDHHNTYAYDGAKDMKGVNLKFTLPTKKEYLDIVFGAMYLDGGYLNDGFMMQNNDSYGRQYILNGGGIYAGISPKWKTKYFGLTSDIALGLFPFKEYNSVVIRDKWLDPVDRISLQQSRTSLFGGMASVGFYVKVGRFSINPTFNVIYAGGSSTSFLFYGFIVPLAVQF